MVTAGKCLRRGLKGSAAANAPANLAQGELGVEFGREGAIYFTAVGCNTARLTDLNLVQVAGEAVKNPLIWNKTFLVTEVVTAKRALIMQSSTANGRLVLGGDIDALLSGSVDASACSSS